jgi:hypothetical protein
MTGKAIYTKATVAYPVGKSDIIFNIEGISPGIYYITLTDTKDALLYSSKILKE